MKQVLYIHGGESFSDYDSYLNRLQSVEIRNLPGSEELSLWSKALSADLGEDFSVFTPKMPNSNNAKFDEWKIWFERHFEYLEDGLVLVGWSLGAMFLTRYLSEYSLPVKVKALLLVSPAGFYFVDSETGEDGGDFNYDAVKIQNLTQNAEKVVIFHSTDDTIIPYEHALKLKEVLPEANLITFEGRNHFLQAEFPELVEHIKEIAR